MEIGIGRSPPRQTLIVGLKMAPENTGFGPSRLPLLGLLATAFFVRLVLAYIIFPDSGEIKDIHWYAQWALALASGGPGHFYAMTDANYPPAYMYVLWLLGMVSKLLASGTNADAVHVAMSLVKIPPMLLDIATGALLYLVAKRWPPNKQTSSRAALSMTAFYVLNPVVLYDSTIWGQTDAAGAFIILVGILALLSWPPEATAAIATVALLIKPQYGVILIPIVSVILFRRHVLSSGVTQAIRNISYWTRPQGPLRVLTACMLSSGIFYILVTPFNLGLRSYIALMASTAREYNLLSVNAFNPWALVGAGGQPPLIAAGIGHCAPDDVPLVGSLTGVEIGSTLLGIAFLVAAIRLLRRSDLQSIVLVSAYLSLCFFIVPTRVHERYVFPAVALTGLLIVEDRRWIWPAVALTIGALINLHAVLSLIGSGNIAALPFGPLFRSPAMIVASITLQTAVLVFSARQLWHTESSAHIANPDAEVSRG